MSPLSNRVLSTCQSYNSKCDARDAKKECQLSNQTKKSSPENLRRNPRSTYYGRMEEVVLSKVLNSMKKVVEVCVCVCVCVGGGGGGV